MLTREQIEEIQVESREKGIPDHQYFWWKRKYGKPDYERRKALRQEKAYPEIKKFETWMEVNIAKCGPKSLMEEAISYTYRILVKSKFYCNNFRKFNILHISAT